MGSLFSSPKPPPPPPAPPPPPDPEVKERERRLEALERRRRGRIGLIKTTRRGLLANTNNNAGNKTLLGD